MSNHIITAIDIGSSNIKTLVVGPKHESRDLEVLSQISQPSFGVRRGVVVDVEKASEIISSALERAETEIGRKIKEVFVSIGGSHIFSTFSHGTIAVSRADQKISREDVERVLQAAQTFSLPQNREILEAFPREFIVDGEKGIKEAEGLEGVRLEAEILVVGCFSPYLKNLQNAVLGADYHVADILCNPLPSAEAVLSPKEKELGILLLDIGSGTTSFCVFAEQSLLGLGVVPVGSGHISNDIAIGLKTDVETAEDIKLKHGACFLGGAKKIKVKEKTTGETIAFSKKSLGKVIDARVSEIFELVQKDLKKVPLPKLPGGVVLCGGGAKLPKIKEFAKKSFKLSSKIGRVSGFFPKIEDPSMTTVCGLVRYGAKDIEKESLSQGIFGKVKSIFKNFIP